MEEGGEEVLSESEKAQTQVGSRAMKPRLSPPGTPDGRPGLLYVLVSGDKGSEGCLAQVSRPSKNWRQLHQDAQNMQHLCSYKMEEKPTYCKRRWPATRADAIRRSKKMVLDYVLEAGY